MRRALLITDLEGVAGVDDLDALVAVSAGFPRAQALLGEEIKAAVTGLAAAGFERVIVSDSHRGGLAQPNVLRDGLPPGVELDFREDAYDAALFDGIEAVACLGMHAPAGSGGFAAHTVDVTCSFILDGRSLSESELVLGLAAAHGVPVLFVAGDDVLGASLPSGLRYVTTKRSLSRSAAQSEPPEQIRLALAAAAAAAAPFTPKTLAADLRLQLRSRWQTEVALELGGERVDAYTVRLPGASFREQYAAGLRISQRIAATLKQAVRRFDRGAAIEDARSFLLRPADHAPPASHDEPARRALAAFLASSPTVSSWQRADRALTLHMLEGHAPRFFAAARLGPVLAEAVAALAEVPADLPIDLPPVEAMARVDAVYVLRERGMSRRLDERAAAAYVTSLAPRSPLFAWLLGELLGQLGLPLRLPIAARARRTVSRVEDLYWLTHLFLLETRYLRRPLAGGNWSAMIEELFLAVPFVRVHRRLDLGAELAFCLQVANERDSGEHRELLALLVAHQTSDGRIVDPRLTSATRGVDEAARLEAHATAAALLAFAGAIGDDSGAGA